MKSWRYYLLVIGFSLLPLVSIFATPDLPHTHDGAVHLPRMAAYYKALLDGQILPRWAGDLNYGYGLPLFNFIYHTPYLVSSLFIALGVNLVNSLKLNLAISYLLAAIGMFLFGQALFKDTKKALLVSVFYQFAPFRLVEMLVRGSLGEMYTYAFFPFLLYGITSSNYLITTFSAGLLIISHNSISLIFFAIALFYTLIFYRTKKNIIALAFGLGVSLFYWLPALFEHKYTYGDLLMKDLFRQHFPPLQNLLLPNFLNDPSLQTGGVSVQIGLFHVVAIILALKERKKIFTFMLGLIIFSLFFMNSFSLGIWENVAILRQFQFSWRLLSVVNFATAILAISYMRIFKKPKFYWLLLFLVIISTAIYWKPPLGFDKVTDEKNAYWNYPLNTTYFGETDVIWSAGPAKAYPPAQVQFIEGSGSVSDIYKKSNLHTYRVESTLSARLVDNTQYFPGWRVYVDDQKVPIEFQNQNWRGLITFPVSGGTHQVKVAFEKSPIQLASEYGTLISLIIILFLAKYYP